jgi:hypothetical protein
VADEEGVAVRLRLGDARRADRAAGPAMFSTMIGWRAPRAMRSANWRASVSVAPPAANGTTSVMGRSG